MTGPTRPTSNTARPARPSTAPSAPSFTISDIYYIVFRHKWKILTCTVLGLAAAYSAKYFVEVPFQSDARLLVRFVISGDDRVAISDEARTKTPDQRGETIMNAEVQILNSFDLARQVAQAVGPARLLGPESGEGDVGAAAAVVRGGLAVTAGKGSSVISITFQHENPDVLQPVLREVIDRYLKTHASVHRGSNMVGDFLSQETDQLRARLALTEEELRRANARLGVVSIPEAKRTVAGQIASMEERILSAQAELAERQAIVKHADGGQPATVTAETEPTVPIDQATLMDYRAALLRLDFLRRRHQELLVQFTSESTRVQEIVQQLEVALRTKQSLEEQHPSLVRTAAVAVTNGSGSLNAQTEVARLTGIQSRIQTLEQQLAALRERARALDEAEGVITQLERRRAMEEGNYLRYASSLEQSRISEALSGGRVSNISVIQTPAPPRSDASALQKARLITGIGGLVFGLVWAGLIEFFIDRSVRRPMDVARVVNLPLFVTIPRLSRRKLEAGANGTALALRQKFNGGKKDGFQIPHALQPFHETLRDRMISFFEAKGLAHKPKLVAVTSIGTDTGATTTAAGLARSLSETGDGNVLLVDMSPGQQTAHQFHRGAPTRGLEETLTLKGDRVPVEENLYIATGGPDDEFARTLPRQLSKLLPKLRASDFDYIIFDMPAVSQISITPRVAGSMDMTFLVVESERTTKDALQRAGEMLTEAGATVGVILNKNRSYLPAKLDSEVLS